MSNDRWMVNKMLPSSPFDAIKRESPSIHVNVNLMSSSFSSGWQWMDLTVICITLWLKIILVDDMIYLSSVEEEQHRSKNQALRYTILKNSSSWGWWLMADGEQFDYDPWGMTISNHTLFHRCHSTVPACWEEEHDQQYQRPHSCQVMIITLFFQSLIPWQYLILVEEVPSP